MDEILLFLMFSLALVLFVVGVHKKNMLFLGFSGIVLLFVGLFLFYGVQLSSGAVIVTSGNTTTITDSYISWNGTFKNPFAWTFVLIGCAVILFSAIKFWEKPASADLEDE